ncbi:hypothetical protein JCM30237_25280 [Halolamina litorea]|uniref:Class I SAM-dependent methyltransferase n=1 Tax=Halolamina litorea TaxID=1515593 RepID=A0ABD6BVE1_9EURY|nr:class I SAM-dependent methyltransferase [Halolamina litorea]
MSRRVPDYYDRADVVTTYAAAREEGLRRRERYAVDRYFDPHGRTLDLGCGTGRTSAVLAEEGFETVGLDSSRPMLAVAAAADPEVRYLAADAATLPFTDGSFSNVLFSYNGLDWLRPESARAAAIRETFRVLEPGGRFAFSSQNVLRWLLPLPPTRYWIGKLARFWRRNAGTLLAGSPYLTTEDGATAHFTDPLSLVRIVRAVGFEVVELVGNRTPGSAVVGNSTFVVASKPPR